MKEETKDLIRKQIISEISLANARTIEAVSNAKFTNENIKTIEVKIKDWASQMTFREENIENEKTKIKNQVEQWAAEFGLEKDKFIEAVANAKFANENIKTIEAELS